MDLFILLNAHLHFTMRQKIKHGDQEQMLFLLDTFEPLLKKYARLLHSEDAFEKLQCFLLSFAKEMPLEKLDAHTNGVVVKYISKAVYHQYIAISKERKKQPRTVYIEEQKDYDLLQYDAVFGESDTYSGLLSILVSRRIRCILVWPCMGRGNRKPIHSLITVWKISTHLKLKRGIVAKYSRAESKKDKQFRLNCLPFCFSPWVWAQRNQARPVYRI